MELKCQLESSHHSTYGFPSVVPITTEGLTARAPSSRSQHSGDAPVSIPPPIYTPSPFLSIFGSPPRPHQLAFLLWDGMRHLCLLRHSDLRPYKPLVGPHPSAFLSLATPHPVVIHGPTERLASELCLPFRGRYYPPGSGVVISVFVDNDDAPLYRSEYYLDGRDLRAVKIDIANCAIRILCMENVLENRFRLPGMSYSYFFPELEIDISNITRHRR